MTKRGVFVQALFRCFNFNTQIIYHILPICQLFTLTFKFSVFGQDKIRMVCFSPNTYLCMGVIWVFRMINRIMDRCRYLFIPGCRHIKRITTISFFAIQSASYINWFRIPVPFAWKVGEFNGLLLNPLKNHILQMYNFYRVDRLL